jgi:hypothetical protein
MRDPNYLADATKPELRPPGAEEAARDITRDRKAFTAAIRTKIFTFLRALVLQDYEGTLAMLATRDRPDDKPWSTDALRTAMDAYHVDHARVRLDPTARNVQHTYVRPSEDGATWTVQQMLIDPDELNDWVTEFSVDIAQSRAAAEPVLSLIRLSPLT